MTGDDAFHAALRLVHRAPPRSTGGLLPAPLGSQLPHRVVRSGQARVRSFYVCDKNVIKDVRPSVGCQGPGATCLPWPTRTS